MPQVTFDCTDSASHMNTETVYGHFEARLGVAPDDATLQDLLITTPCGIACCKVIDAAAAYLEIADQHVDVREPLIESVSNAVSVLWVG